MKAEGCRGGEVQDVCMWVAIWRAVETVDGGGEAMVVGFLKMKKRKVFGKEEEVFGCVGRVKDCVREERVY